MEHPLLVEYAMELLKQLPTEYDDLVEKIAIRFGDFAKLEKILENKIKANIEDALSYKKLKVNASFVQHEAIVESIKSLINTGKYDIALNLGRYLIAEIAKAMTKYNLYLNYTNALIGLLPHLKQAVQKSSLSEHGKVLYLVELILKDPNQDVIDPEFILNDIHKDAAFWREFTPHLIKLLDSYKYDPTQYYKKEHPILHAVKCLSRYYIDHDLNQELTGIYHAEFNATHSPNDYIDHLINTGMLKEAKKVIANHYIDRLPNIHAKHATECFNFLIAIARLENDIDQIMTIQTIKFFYIDQNEQNYLDLIKTAERLEKKEIVREATISHVKSKIFPYSPSRTTPEIEWPISISKELLKFVPKIPLNYSPDMIMLKIYMAESNVALTLEHYEKYCSPREGSDARSYEYNYYLKVISPFLLEKVPHKLVEYTIELLNISLKYSGEYEYFISIQHLTELHSTLSSIGLISEWWKMNEALRNTYSRRKKFIDLLDQLEKKLSQSESTTIFKRWT